MSAKRSPRRVSQRATDRYFMMDTLPPNLRKRFVLTVALPEHMPPLPAGRTAPLARMVQGGHNARFVCVYWPDGSVYIVIAKAFRSPEGRRIALTRFGLSPHAAVSLASVLGHALESVNKHKESLPCPH